MSLNSFPINTVAPTADLIVNTPSGIVSATDVQSAINQLAILIPAVGPGTDPLSLVNGLSVTAPNPTFSGNANDRWAVKFEHDTDCSNVQPDFCNVEVLSTQMTCVNGQATFGGTTQVKESFYNVINNSYAAGSGQKFVTGDSIQSYGMSDTSIGQQLVQYAGGPINGDEGQGFRLVSRLIQQQQLSVFHISSIPAASTLTTTTTQSITRNLNPQTITVASSTGAMVGDWVVVDQELPTASPNMEAVKITAVGVGTISGIFRCNHLTGATIKPALRLVLDGAFALGQDRVLVNMSATPYTTGTVSTISGGGFTGSGTTWTNGMVGGNALNIGAISLAADDYTNTPFGSGANTLRSWYQINTIASNTSLGIFRTSVAGDGSYHGQGPGAGTYTIRPCAKILRLVTSPGTATSLTGEVICENSTSTWTVGDTVEQVICPYPDVTGFQYQISNWTNGATLRSFWQIRNMGARTFDNCLFVDNWDQTSQAGGDGVNWRTILNLQASCNTAIAINASKTTVCALSLGAAFQGAGFTDAGGRIAWGTVGAGAAYMDINTPNGGLEFLTIFANGDTDYGRMSFGFQSTRLSSVASEVNDIKLRWGGALWGPVLNGHRGSLYIDYDSTSSTSYERGFVRWNINSLGNPQLEFGTSAGSGGGTVHDFALLKGPDVYFTSSLYVVSTLPAAGVAGRRFFVIDATATTFQSIVAGGGANFVPVFDDGTHWRIG